MRVLLVGPQILYPWGDYTARALRRLGHETTLFLETSLFVDGVSVRKGRQIASAIPGLVRVLDRWRSSWVEARDRHLLRTARHLRPELILVLTGSSFSSEFLRQLRDLARCPMVTWWVDDPFRYPTDRFFHRYDTVFIFDRSYEGRLRADGARDVRFLPCACDETVYSPQLLRAKERLRYRSEIALVSWYSKNRVPVVGALKRFDLRIWGRGWRRPDVYEALDGKERSILQEERFVPDHEAARIFSAAQIGLNIHSGQSHLGGLNARTFDLCASGAFQMVDAIPGMEELMEPGKELVVYRSPQEALDLAEHYLKHPEERAPIAARGRQRTLAHHTYLHRVRRILDTVQGRPAP